MTRRGFHFGLLCVTSYHKLTYSTVWAASSRKLIKGFPYDHNELGVCTIRIVLYLHVLRAKLHVILYQPVFGCSKE